MKMPSRAPATAREVIAAYRLHASANGVHCKEASAQRARVFDEFLATYGELPVEELRPYHLTDFINAHPTWKSSATKRGRANAIRAAFQWAVDEERIDRNPFRNLRYDEADPRPVMPDDALDTLCRFARKEMERAYRFLRLTGCRVSDLCNVRWCDVDLERGIWTVPQHKSRKKTRKPLLRVLTAECVELLRLIQTQGVPPEQPPLPGMESTVPIFLNSLGRPWTRQVLWKNMDRCRKRHGITRATSLHGIRHQAGTEAIANGGELKLVSQQLGHKSTAITERYYCHLTEDHAARIKAAFSRGHPRSVEVK